MCVGSSEVDRKLKQFHRTTYYISIHRAHWVTEVTTSPQYIPPLAWDSRLAGRCLGDGNTREGVVIVRMLEYAEKVN